MFNKSNKNIAKKGKPSYAMSIIGVTIVLFLWGLLGLLGLYVAGFKKQVSENVKMFVYLDGVAQQQDIDSLMGFIKAQPYSRDVKFISKEEAKNEMIGLRDETVDFSLMDSINPLPNTISFFFKNEYVQPEKLKEIKNSLIQGSSLINDVTYSAEIVEKISAPFKKLRYILLGLAVLLSILVFLLIDNTIRLAMYSNRFLIKTMQMVGATRNFIALPMDKRAVFNGLISAGIAIVLLYFITVFAKSKLPDIAPDISQSGMLWLFLALLLAGVLITLISTHRSVIKYLKMRLDDLYYSKILKIT
jgi:cell division transport system permease protein